MDRYTGIVESDQGAERQAWEADQQAIAEYESWYLNKTIMEAEAEFLDVR